MVLPGPHPGRIHLDAGFLPVAAVVGQLERLLVAALNSCGPGVSREDAAGEAQSIEAGLAAGEPNFGRGWMSESGDANHVVSGRTRPKNENRVNAEAIVRKRQLMPGLVEEVKHWVHRRAQTPAQQARHQRLPRLQLK